MVKRTPNAARIYLLLAAFLLALPTLSSFYKGYTGKLLVAGDLIDSGPFHESVIYLVRHDLFSAHGFIINKPLKKSFPYPDLDQDLPGLYGGPVQNPEWKRFAVFRNGKFSSLQRSPQNNIREGERQFVVSGYAGWGPLQLNFEYLRGAWMVMDFDPGLLFDNDPELIWFKAVAKYRKNHPPEPEKKI